MGWYGRSCQHNNSLDWIRQIMEEQEKCSACGCGEEIMIHGHYQCSNCGKLMDGDCCQGEQIKDRIDTNYEARDY